MWLFEYQVQIQPVYGICKNLHLYERDIFMYIEQFEFFPWQFWTRIGDIIVFKWLYTLHSFIWILYIQCLYKSSLITRGTFDNISIFNSVTESVVYNTCKMYKM